MMIRRGIDLFKLFALISAVCAVGCGDKIEPDKGSQSVLPIFTLAWSEYPSWSVFGVAHEDGLINGKKGELGDLEHKWGVDIVLREANYGPCLQMYGSGQCDAVCVTELDAFNPSNSRKSVLILPTSTSDGADALVVTKDITKIAQLEGKKVYGLEKSVSEYCFFRNIELQKMDRADFTFSNRDPHVAAISMQLKDEDVKAIVVWNPFLLETLKKRDDVHVLLDSTSMPKEIIDSVVVAQDSLDKPGGKKFACALIDAFYAVNVKLSNKGTRDETLVKLGEKFASGLEVADMEKILGQTKIYSTPEAGLALLSDKELPNIVEKVGDLCYGLEFFDKRPKVGFGDQATEGDADLRFDPSYIKMYQAGPSAGSK